MQARFLEYSEKYKVSYGDVLTAFNEAKAEAKAKRLKPDSPKFHVFAIEKLSEILETKYGANVDPVSNNTQDQPDELVTLAPAQDEIVDVELE